MGLDMFLTATIYTSEFSNPELNKKLNNLISSEISTEEDSSVSLTVEIGYWRKANAIHNWFVHNVQEGEDDCEKTYVSPYMLKELRELCEKALADRQNAHKYLPSTSGFFFGSTEYDTYYFDYLENTIKIIDRALSLPKGWSCEYQSSW